MDIDTTQVEKVDETLTDTPEKKLVTVYEFDLTDRLHTYTGETQVEENADLADNQTVDKPTGMYWNDTSWTNDLETVYCYDSEGFDTHEMRVIPKDAPLEDGETLLAPDYGKLYKPKFVDGAWVEGLTTDEIAGLADNTQQELAVLKKQVAAGQVTNAQLKQVANYLGLKISKLEAQVATDTAEKTETESEA